MHETEYHDAGEDTGTTILVVDDEASINSLVKEVLSPEGYSVTGVRTARAALSFLRRQRPGLLLTDVRMPGEDGLWLLRVLRSQYPEIPVVMMTGLDDIRTAVSCLRDGAADYLSKPLDVDELRISVRRALHRYHLETENLKYKRGLEEMVLDRTREMRRALHQKEEACNLLLEALVSALDAREQDTHHHSLRVASYTAAMMREAGAEEELVVEAYKGALLHDVGKIGIPDAILLKPGPLTEAEWEIMRTHPEIGARILEGIPFLAAARRIVLTHHERWDGLGYPCRLAGEQIPLGSRVFAVADTFDAMTTHRPYRGPLPLTAVVDEVRRCAGSQFDPEVSELFLQMLSEDRLLPRRVMDDAVPEALRAHALHPFTLRVPGLPAATGNTGRLET